MNYDIIRDKLKSKHWVDRYYALLDCIKELDVPLDIIQMGLNDEIGQVNNIALDLCKDRKDITQKNA